MCYACGNNIIYTFARHKMKQIIRRNKLFFQSFQFMSFFTEVTKYKTSFM